MTDRLTGLHDHEIEPVVAVVRALVARDERVLAEHGAYHRGANPYLWVDDYDDAGGVDLVMPPGDPRTWPGHIFRASERPGWAAVDVEIWDRARGRTDLTLELEVLTRADGGVQVTFEDLHVM